MITISQRIEDHVNEHAPRALARALGFFVDFTLPRWALALLAVGVGQVLLLDLKGELALRNWLIAVFETFL